MSADGLDEIDERAQRCGQEAPAGIVEKRPREALPPRFKDGLQCTTVQMRAQPVLKKVELGATPMQVALAWLLRRAPNILLIPGTSFVAHLRENLAAGQLTLSPQTLAELDGIAS